VDEKLPNFTGYSYIVSTSDLEPPKDPDPANDDVVSEIKDDSALLASALGGWTGVIDAGLPFMVFTIVYLVSDRDLETTLYAAVGTAAVLALLRLVRRQSLQQVFSGLIGIGIAAFLAQRTGNADNFFLPGIITNTIYAGVCLISIFARKPLLGYVIEAMRGRDMSWVKNPESLRLFSTITWLWALIFGVRVAIMFPLYLMGQTAALGTLKILLGYPLFAFGIFATFRLLAKAKKDSEISND
jgi:intracellular septation protein A